ncbi:aspartate aminotransferase [Aspergillus steynii IBT 23096]|uniref:Aspartate aminotransferase n=1 Tax=Aspergillus steynii IBT 23096 TaxID=1392250 RepID=A0A2I2GNS1_9EURO|nr:aspartate aminotransferase [Aspergillus steynii IBT 23096]PLB54531.1 aspartate aminotransferase [Aspergillus steynii IBT 23096]
MFEKIPLAPSDPLLELKRVADSDSSPHKVNLGIGVYQNEQGQIYEPYCITMAKEKLALEDPDHDYTAATGIEEYLTHTAELVFGSNSEPLKSQRVASVQTIAGTGAIHLGALFLSKVATSPGQKVYVGTPTWGNHEPLFQLVKMQLDKYNHYDKALRKVDIESCLAALRRAPENSVFIFQVCCHNPTGADFSTPQWQLIADEMQRRNHVPMFDFAYQGLGEGENEDAYPIRLFAARGFEMLVCQSFSKNFGLYGERVGALHVVTKSREKAGCIFSQLRRLIRSEFSSSPAYGARLVNIILRDQTLRQAWAAELDQMRTRLKRNRLRLYESFLALETPGDWSHILHEKGLFSYLRLTPQQCHELTAHFNIYLVSDGRINVAGLNDSCIRRVARHIDLVVRDSLNAIPEEAIEHIESRI